jgi:thiamine kinase-like enzyme
VGLQLAALHGVDVPLPRQITAAHLKKRPHELAALLGEVDKSWMQPLLRLALRLERDAGALEGHAPVTLHGSLSPAGLLLDGQQRIVFTDLESAQRGPAALDLGAWIADSFARALRASDPAPVVTRAWQSFVAGYAAGGGDYVPEPVLAWATAFNLCELAWRNVTRGRAGHFAPTAQLIELAETIAQAGTPRAAEGTRADGERRQIA